MVFLLYQNESEDILMKDLSLMTWKDIESLDKQKSIVFVTIAPIEEHSVCLPLATDLIEGEYWSKKTMKMLETRENYNCFYLPSVPIASASVNEFYGCIHYSMKTTYLVTKELLDNLVSMGFLNIVLIASHADPEHQIAVEKAVEKINKRYGIRAISPMGACFSIDELKIKHSTPKEIIEMEKKYPNDYHAGWIETSNMLAINDLLVKENYQKIPASTITDKEMISKKKQRKAMGSYGHIGNPSVANQEIGKLLNQDASQFLFEAINSFVKRDNYQIYMHHFLYR